MKIIQYFVLQEIFLYDTPQKQCKTASVKVSLNEQIVKLPLVPFVYNNFTVFVSRLLYVFWTS